MCHARRVDWRCAQRSTNCLHTSYTGKAKLSVDISVSGSVSVRFVYNFNRGPAFTPRSTGPTPSAGPKGLHVDSFEVKVIVTLSATPYAKVRHDGGDEDDDDLKGMRLYLFLLRSWSGL